jgi:CheY-like chemotaxis protein
MMPELKNFGFALDLNVKPPVFLCIETVLQDETGCDLGNRPITEVPPGTIIGWVAEAAELMLAAEGHSGETAANGEEALRLAVEKDYDLILLDIMLPDTDGFEVINRLREARTAIPILCQTGLVDQKDLSASLGVPDCLAKPFNAMTVGCPREARLPLATRKSGKRNC